MSATVSHFSIECDDVERAKAFYEAVFDWTARAWGPPNYYLASTGPAERPGIGGDLRSRREPLSGTGSPSYECTIVVDSLAETLAAIEAHGGRIVDAPYVIEGVGELAYFHDTEGNRAGVMQQVPGLPPRDG
jgi:predicted enzyme related to lactoylglutathione lyase